MAGADFTLIHVNAVHVAGRAVVPDLTGALVGAVNVPAHFIDATWIVESLALVYVLTNSPINQDEAGLAEAGEGALVVDTRGFISATSVIHLTLIYISALDHTISRITHEASAVKGARMVGAKGVGVALPGLQAFINICTGEAVSPVP